ncbi:MAG: MoaD/ThiS family protein [Methanomassiliicoccales archaeon]|nr:MoaD/ThiS family protein [Methanomassiliicoccales archaeon]
MPSVRIQKGEETKPVQLSEGATIEDLLRQLGLFPDAHIVMIGARPVPLTYVLVEGDLLRILKVASGG